MDILKEVKSEDFFECIKRQHSFEDEDCLSIASLKKLQRKDENVSLNVDGSNEDGKIKLEIKDEKTDFELLSEVTSKTYKCEICSLLFPKRKLLRIHLKLHPDKELHNCCHYSEKSKSKCKWVAHNKTHKTKQSHHCLYCSKNFGNKSTLIKHEKIHTKESFYKCQYCQKEFIQKAGYLSHLKIHTGEGLFSCQVCSKKFNRKSSLVSHEKLHTGKDLWKCELCNKSFPVRSKLSLHLQGHAGIKPHVCDVCGRSYSQKHSLQIHYQLHTEGKQFTCEVCAKTFSKKISVERHMLIHNNIKEFQCNLCNHWFRQKSQLQAHACLKVKHQKPFLCDECGKAFRRKDALQMHARRHMYGDIIKQSNRSNLDLTANNSNNCPFVCDVNGQPMFDVTHSKHEEIPVIASDKNTETQYQIGNETITGPNCAFALDESNNILNTVEKGKYSVVMDTQNGRDCEDYESDGDTHRNQDVATPTNSTSSSCEDTSSGESDCEEDEKCKEIVKNLLEMIEAEALGINNDAEWSDDKESKSDVAQQNNKLMCHICSKLYTKKSSLASHMKLHTGDKLTECQYCKKVFTAKSKYLSHVKIHTGVKEYACNVCDKWFTHAHSLEAHAKLHTVIEKHFQCHLCTKQFTKKVSLDRHLATHTGERPYSCDVCGAAFIQRSQLKTHVRSRHTNDRPYLCSFCGRAFSRSDALKTHIKTHTLKHIINEENYKRGGGATVKDRPKMNDI